MLQQFIDGVDVGVGQVKVLDLVSKPLRIAQPSAEWNGISHTAQERTSNMNKILGGIPDHRCPHGLWW